MPNTKSAIRRVRRVKKQTLVNRVRKSKYKSAVKHMEKLIKKVSFLIQKVTERDEISGVVLGDQPPHW